MSPRSSLAFSSVYSGAFRRVRTFEKRISKALSEQDSLVCFAQLELGHVVTARRFRPTRVRLRSRPAAYEACKLPSVRLVLATPGSGAGPVWLGSSSRVRPKSRSSRVGFFPSQIRSSWLRPRRLGSGSGQQDGCSVPHPTWSHSARSGPTMKSGSVQVRSGISHRSTSPHHTLLRRCAVI
jgi:hypothetical protein